MARPLARPRSTLVGILVAWAAFYASFTLFTPPLLDDADSVHVEVAREMLLRGDPITLYANGIRYLEKAPLLYWSMAASMRAAQLLGAHSPRALVAAARLPLALTVLALALVAEAFGRRLVRRVYAGLYAALILLSSFGVFIFTRIMIPDAMVCLWLTLALYCFWLTERIGSVRPPSRDHAPVHRTCCFGFAIACALNVLTKGLIGLVFPVAIATIYILLTRGVRRTILRIREFHLIGSLAVFLLLAAPWHILAALANPGHGRPAPFRFLRGYAFPLHLGHWQVPLPADGNVRGWTWFYFMNEHLLRYLNLRVPHDYDTVPLALFLGLCLVWIMPWSAFLPQALHWALPVGSPKWRGQLRRHDLPLRQRGQLLLVVWAGFVLLFFSASTRQEYYVLPALPALAVLIAGWLATATAQGGEPVGRPHDPVRTPLLILAGLGALFTTATAYLRLHTPTPAPGADLSDLLTQNPGEYALSFGHFLDLDTRALALFRAPMLIAACGLLLGPLAALAARRRGLPHTGTLLLSAGAFTFLLAAHLGLRTFAPVLSSAQLAQAIAPQLQPDDLLVVHGEYEAGSTLAFYLHRPSDYITDTAYRAGFGIGPHLTAIDPILIHEGRSSNLWYGSFFPDAPHLFLTASDLATLWAGPRRIFMWQSLTDAPNRLPSLPGPVYVLGRSGGKEIVSNQPNR